MDNYTDVIEPIAQQLTNCLPELENAKSAMQIEQALRVRMDNLGALTMRKHYEDLDVCHAS